MTALVPSSSSPRRHVPTHRVRRAVFGVVVVLLAGAAYVSLRGGLFARPVAAELPVAPWAVQAAVDAAEEGATVRIGPGIFEGPVRLGARSIRLIGAGDERTILCSTGEAPVLSVHAAPGVRVQIENLTIAGNDSSAPGLLVEGGYADVHNVTFRGHHGSAAVVREGGQAVFTDCVFRDNHSGYAGGAVFNAGGAVLLLHCVLEENRARTFGGAVYSKGGVLETMGCTFTRNYTDGGAFGGAVYGEATRLRAIASSFDHNESADAGGAVYLHGGQADIERCRFAGNVARDAWALYSAGTGIRLQGSTLCGARESLLGGDFTPGAGNSFQDNCFPDCNRNGIDDTLELARGWLRDADGNGIPDVCESRYGMVRDEEGNLIVDDIPFVVDPAQREEYYQPKRTRRDSNPRPLVSKTNALSN